MLRIVFLLLLLGNTGYYLWSHGHLAGMGLAPEAQSEPQRLQEQIKPDALTLLPPQPEEEFASAKPVPAPQVDDIVSEPKEVAQVAEEKPEKTQAPKEDKPPELVKPTESKELAKETKKEAESCYQANGIEEAQADSIRRALASKARSDWELVPTHQNGRWMVYMGKFPDTDFLDRKRGELSLMNIDFDRAGGNFEPGLSLGRFSTEEAAQRQLAAYLRQGVRTARVVQERPDVTTYALRLPKATPTLRNEVAALAGKNLVPKALQACSK